MLVRHACYVRSLNARGQRQMPTKKCYSLRERERGVGGQGNAQFTGNPVNSPQICNCLIFAATYVHETSAVTGGGDKLSLDSDCTGKQLLLL